MDTMEVEATDLPMLSESGLDYRDIIRGRLSTIKSNPFAALDNESLRRSRRDKKRASTSFARARFEVESLEEPSRATRDGNQYEVLYISEAGFLGLAAETRNAIYDIILADLHERYPKRFEGQPDRGYNINASIVKGHKYSSTSLETSGLQLALLLVNKQVAKEWRSYLDDCIPIQMFTRPTLKMANSPFEFAWQGLEKAFPVLAPDLTDESSGEPKDDIQTSPSPEVCHARGVFLDVNCDVTECNSPWDPETGVYDEKLAAMLPTEEQVHLAIVTSTGFEDLGKRLRLCDNLEDLVVHWRFGTSEGYTGPAADTPNMLFESILQVAETIPTLKRYLVRVGNWNAAFASRSAGQDWSSDTTLRVTYDEWTGGRDDETCVQLYRDLDISLRGW